MENINLLISKLIIFHKNYIGETIIYPDQYGNYTIILLFYLFLLPFIFFYRNDYKKIKLIFFLFIFTVFIKTFLFFSPYSSCKKIDTDGYTSIASWNSTSNSNRLNPNFIYSSKENISSLIFKDNFVLLVNKNNIYKIQNKKKTKIDINLKVLKVFSLDGLVYVTNLQNELFLINDNLKSFSKIYTSKNIITDLKSNKGEIYLSTIDGKIKNIKYNTLYIDHKIPVKSFNFIEDSVYVEDFYNVLSQYEEKKLVNKINFHNVLPKVPSNISINVLKKYHFNLELVKEIFKNFYLKDFNIKQIDTYKDNLIILFFNGKVANFKNFYEAIETADKSINRHDLENNINYLINNSYIDKIFIKDNNLFATNYYDDIFNFNLDDNQNFILKNSSFDEQNLKSFLGYKYYKDVIRLPGYIFISSSLMKITQIFNACNIVVLQHLILILSLILILLTKVKKNIFILIFLMLVLFDPYNYLNKLLSQDNPHVFEMIIFSFFIFIQVFIKKRYLTKFIMVIFLLLISSLISSKIIVAILIFLFVEFIYFLFLSKKRNHLKLFQIFSYIIFILLNSYIVGNYFEGQTNYNSANIKQKFISYLMIKNSNLFEINHVNDFKKTIGIELEKKNIYLNHGILGGNRYPIYSEHLSGYQKQIIINQSTGNLIKPINATLLDLIFLTKKQFILESIDNFFKNIEVLISVSDIQKKNNLTLSLSFIIFFIGLSQSSKLYKDYNLILLFSLLGLYSFYTASLVPQSRFILIYNLYLYTIYYFGFSFLLKNVKNFLRINI